MKPSRLKLGLRTTPYWVEERMADRPPWRCRNDAEREHFMEFVINELHLRFIIEIAVPAAAKLEASLSVGPPADGRRKPWHVRSLDPAKLAALAVPIIREIFEDYWSEGREGGRLYRGHDPSVEEIAAKFGEVSVEDVKRQLKKAQGKRPVIK